MDYGEKEHIFFRGAAKYVHNQSDEVGYLVVTSTRLYFMVGSTMPFECALAAIKKPQYKKSDLMMRLILEGSSDVPVFTLQNQNELDLNRLKESFREAVESAQSSGRSSTKDMRAQRRRELRNADPSLNRSYKELVEQDKILTEEEFWEHEEQQIYAMTTSNAARKTGRLTELLSDVKTVEVDDDKNLKKLKKRLLTPEIIQAIFDMYAPVKAAYDRRVPREMTDDEFWKRYFDSEYFQRDRPVLHQSKTNKLPVSTAVDIFIEEEAMLAAQAAKASNATGKTVAELTGAVDSAMDLSLTEGDRLGARSIVTGDDDHDHASAPHVTNKYNRHSTLLLGDKEKASALKATSSSASSSSSSPCSSSSSSKRDRDDGDVLLHERPKPAYIPLKIMPCRVGSMTSVAASLEDERPVQQQNLAFRKLERAQPSAKRTRVDPDMITSLDIIQPPENVFGLGGDYEMDMWKKDLDELQKQKTLSKKEKEEEMKKAKAGGSAIDLTGAHTVTRYGMNAEFQADMLKKYKDMTHSCLKIFYSFLDKLLSNQADGCKRQEMVNRMKKLRDRIHNMEEALMACKNKLRSGGSDEVQRSLYCINEMIGLISRSKAHLFSSKVLDP